MITCTEWERWKKGEANAVLEFWKIDEKANAVNEFWEKGEEKTKNAMGKDRAGRKVRSTFWVVMILCHKTLPYPLVTRKTLFNHTTSPLLPRIEYGFIRNIFGQ